MKTGVKIGVKTGILNRDDVLSLPLRQLVNKWEDRMLLKLSKIIVIGTLFAIPLGSMSVPHSVMAKPKIKVFKYSINIHGLDNFRISDKQKKRIIKRIVSGFNAWNGLPDVYVKFEYVGSSKAKYNLKDKVNVVHFSMDEEEFNKIKKRVKAGDALAVTKKVGDKFDVIIYGEGFLGMGRDGLYLNFPGFGANDLQSAMAHEAGHALGLGHSSKKNAVMYKRLPRTKRRTPIEKDDIKKARKLYPCPKKSKDSKTSYVPPEGWQPYGESIGTPDKPDKASQAATKEATDTYYGAPVKTDDRTEEESEPVMYYPPLQDESDVLDLIPTLPECKPDEKDQSEQSQSSGSGELCH